MSRRNIKRNRGQTRRPNRKRRGRQNRQENAWAKQFQANPIHSRTIRYIATTATSGVEYITAASMLNLILSHDDSGTTTSAVNVMGAVRLRRVAMYYVSTSGLGTDSGEINLSWLGTNSPERQITCRGTVFKPAVIIARPPTRSFASFWYNSQDADITNILFNYSCPQYTIFDITFDFTLGEGPTDYVSVTDPAITGIGYAALDNSTNGLAIYTLRLHPDSILQYFIVTDPDPLAHKRRRLAENTKGVLRKGMGKCCGHCD